jgi:hypothetical protein
LESEKDLSEMGRGCPEGASVECEVNSFKVGGVVGNGSEGGFVDTVAVQVADERTMILEYWNSLFVVVS